jgi:NADPH2:quinone reductase
MRVIRVHEFGGPEVLRYEEVPDPTPGPGHVVVRVHAVGVNPVDTYIRTGTYASKPALPYTPGSDAAGEVEAVGDGVTGVRPGDRVYTGSGTSGAYAEKLLADAARVYPLPGNVSFAQGAALGVPYVTAYRALVQRARAQAGETVLVHGATGGVGIAAVQIARALGLTVFGTAGSPAGAEVVLREGAHQVFSHREDGYLDRAKAATPGGGRGFDIILEMLANVNLGRDLPALATYGRVVIVGSRGPVEINPRDTMGRDASILGMTLFNTPPDEMRAIHAALYAGLENGTLRPVVGRELPLTEAARAHHEIMDAGNYTRGKIILVP